jgi:hypothetical protein
MIDEGAVEIEFVDNRHEVVVSRGYSGMVGLA